ncbi:MAG: slipin family protein [Patescibacteria group bacterium]|jgi:regulator of protease activity HflC (stomatin/prohibitin superfamily)
MYYLLIVVIVLILGSIKQVNQYQRGIKLRLGKFAGVVDPGWRIVWPVIESMVKMDIRVKAADVPYQDTITKDNISCKINAVIYYRFAEPAKAYLEVENVMNAVSQLAQTTMRNICGEMTLDELLSNREVAANHIKTVIAQHATAWGVEVGSVELKDISLPDDMVRTIAKQAEAEREKRAVIIKSEGELAAADNLSRAANILASSDGAMHLRTLATLNDVSSDQSNTIVFAIPLEVLRAFERMGRKE